MVNELISRERLRIIETYGPYNSAHEGYSILAEEINEIEDEMNILKVAQDLMWTEVKNDNLFGAKKSAERIKKRAIRIIAEAIQVAAVCDKFQDLEGVYAVFNKSK